ncbi:MAG: DsrE family protein [Desulfobacterales bacterium]|nr:DsrE family protein [Desulfobacterales bacterium]MCP4159805.1 DsrE family protein [Deltaproteobacteria bacterium]
MDEKKPLTKMWKEVKEKKLVDGVCKACAGKMGTMDEAEKQGLALLDDMKGHPSVSRYIDSGYKIITL